MSGSDPNPTPTPSSDAARQSPRTQPRPGTNPSSPSASHYTVELPYAEELEAMLEGRYLVEGFLGQGGMGAVYKGLQLPLKRPVAIKILQRQTTADDFGFEERFKREAYAMASLTHPNIVQVYDCGDAGENFLFISMELVEGGDLSDAIKSGSVTPESALVLIQQICDGLHAAHERGLVHRDIKPANIFLTAGGRAKVADFGLAKKFDVKNTLLTKTGLGMGTPDYAAPEQYEGVPDIDHRADIYALGVMFYQMLTGTLPRGNFKPPSQRVPVDRRLDDVVRRAMEPERNDRYQSAAEMKSDILAILQAGNAGVATHTGPVPPNTGNVAVRGPHPAAAPRPHAPRASQPSTTQSAAQTSPARAKGKPKTRLIVGLLGSVAAVGLGAFLLSRGADNGSTASKGESQATSTSGQSSAVEEAFMKAVANASTPDEQVALVEKKIENISGIPISAKSRIENGVLVGLTLTQDGGSDQVKDFSPVAALRDLSRLSIMYLNPADLSFLRGMKISHLTIHRGSFTDISPLRDLPLTSLEVLQTRVADWSSISGKPLTTLALGLGPISDIAFVKGMPLARLTLDRTKVTDLSPIRGLPLTDLTFDKVDASHADILRSIPTLTRVNGKPVGEFWANAGLPPPPPAPSAPPTLAMPQVPPPVPAAWVDLWSEARAKSLESGKIVDEAGAWRAIQIMNNSSKVPLSNAVLRVRAAHTGGLQLLLRNIPGSRMYRMMVMGGARPMLRLELFDHKTQSVTRELVKVAAPSSFDLEKEHEFQFAVAGSTLRGWLDSSLLLEARDSELTSGSVGCYCPKGVLMRSVEFGDLSKPPAIAVSSKQDDTSIQQPEAAMPATNAPPELKSPSPTAPSASTAVPPPAPPATASPAPSPAPPPDPRLAQLDAGFKARYEAEAQKPYASALSSLNQSYVNTGIARARATAQQQGALADITALDDEARRFQKNDPLPPTDPDELSPAVKQLRATYRSALSKIEADRAKKAAPLYDLYLGALDTYIAELTKADKIDQAQVVDGWRKQLAAQKPVVEVDPVIAPNRPPSAGAARSSAKSGPLLEDGGGGRSSRWYEATRWVISVGGSVDVVKNGVQTRVEKESEIPPGRFDVRDVIINAGPKSNSVKDEDFVRFTGLPLRFIRLTGLKISDQAFAFLPTVPTLEGFVLSDMAVTDAVLSYVAALANIADFQIQRAPQFTGNGLDKLACLPRLTNVWLNGCGVTDSAVNTLSKAANLDMLNLDSTNVSDEGIAGLVGLKKLRRLNLTRCANIRGSALQSWGPMPAMEELYLCTPNLDGDAIAYVRQMPNLRLLALDDVKALTDDKLGDLNGLTKVTSFSAIRTPLTGVGFANLDSWKSLTKLGLHYETAVSSEGLAAIVKALPNLESLTLGKAATVAAADLPGLASLKHLKTLVLPLPSLDDAALEVIGALATLNELHLGSSKVTAKGLSHLRAVKPLAILVLTDCKSIDDSAVDPLSLLRSLKQLNLKGTAISAKGIAELKKALPSCRLEP